MKLSWQPILSDRFSEINTFLRMMYYSVMKRANSEKEIPIARKIGVWMISLEYSYSSWRKITLSWSDVYVLAHSGNFCIGLDYVLVNLVVFGSFRKIQNPKRWIQGERHLKLVTQCSRRVIHYFPLWSFGRTIYSPSVVISYLIANDFYPGLQSSNREFYCTETPLLRVQNDVLL